MYIIENKILPHEKLLSDAFLAHENHSVILAIIAMMGSGKYSGVGGKTLGF